MPSKKSQSNIVHTTRKASRAALLKPKASFTNEIDGYSINIFEAHKNEMVICVDNQPLKRCTVDTCEDFADVVAQAHRIYMTELLKRCKSPCCTGRLVKKGQRAS